MPGAAVAILGEHAGLGGRAQLAALRGKSWGTHTRRGCCACRAHQGKQSEWAGWSGQADPPPSSLSHPTSNTATQSRRCAGSERKEQLQQFRASYQSALDALNQAHALRAPALLHPAPAAQPTVPALQPPVPVAGGQASFQCCTAQTHASRKGRVAPSLSLSVSSELGALEAHLAGLLDADACSAFFVSADTIQARSCPAQAAARDCPREQQRQAVLLPPRRLAVC